ncbi:hypothetical protein F4821DRAFT_143391 [Hypoxylon rubiginosum]|uniref:Uncharacterized protein n=1 Tax=Hypoxylon rubiginosum TaxID=110542 RepID=A0ACC0CZM7_9PEZI|nr:hypothetical protein F4821DRAFT_143391 [Hypoxylon rubiginosum]
MDPHDTSLSRGHILRFARILVSIAVLLLAFRLHYPEWTYHVALVGVVLFWGLTQLIDVDCGGISEINITWHIYLDMLVTILSITMLINLGIWEMHCSGATCRVYWWTICSWGILAIINGVISSHSIKNYPKRRRGNHRSTARIMFTPSGDPVVAVFNLQASPRSRNGRISLDSLCIELENRNSRERRQSVSHVV